MLEVAIAHFLVFKCLSTLVVEFHSRARDDGRVGERPEPNWMFVQFEPFVPGMVPEEICSP